MRRLLSVSVAVCATSLAFVAPQAPAATHRVLGGAATSITSAPWQVAIFAAPPASPDVAEFSPNPPPEAPVSHFAYECGGVILDATHVLTAAHCVNVTASDFFADPFDRQVFETGTWTYGVSAGTSFLSGGDPGLQASVVTNVARDPMYDGANYDVAVLTLKHALTLDGTFRAAIPFAATDPATGATLSVTGWGKSLAADSTADSTDALQIAPVHVTDLAACQTAYHGVQIALTAGATLCAAGTDPVRADCDKDAGGPLVDTTSPAHLVGIYSGGLECSQSQFSGFYTSMSSAQVQAFITAQLTAATPGADPVLVGPLVPQLTGSLLAGQTLTCTTGQWLNTQAYKFTFFDPNKNLQLQTATGISATYTVQPSDTGRDIACSVRAANIDGASTFVSNPVGPAADQSGNTTPGGSTPGGGNQQTPDAVKKDTTKPRAVITSSKCTATKCTLHVAADDKNYSAGIASLSGTVRTTVSRRCGSHTCTRTVTQKLKVTKLKTNGYFLVTVTNLPRGKHRFSLTMTDKAGNKQTKATTKTIAAR